MSQLKDTTHDILSLPDQEAIKVALLGIDWKLRSIEGRLDRLERTLHNLEPFLKKEVGEALEAAATLLKM